MEIFEKRIIDSLAERTGLNRESIEEVLEVPVKEGFGDFSFPCFQLAKTLGVSPAVAARSISTGLEVVGIEKVEAVGPYVNFFVSQRELASLVIPDILEKRARYGYSAIGQGKVMVIDFSSVNIAKPFHIGHLKSTAIGNSLYKIFSCLGYKCIGINHLGDWGTQFGKLIVAYQKWWPTGKECSVRDLVDIYVRFHREAEQDESLNDQAREAFKRLEQGENLYVELWERFRAISLKEFERVYSLLKVKFDFWQGESFYNDKINEVIASLEEKGLLENSQGAYVVDLAKFGLPPCLVKRSDGASLYATRDLAAILYRKREFGFYRAIYVVGSTQKLHFQQVFGVIELMGFPWSSDLIHVDFGQVSLPGGPMSTRKGSAIYLDDVLGEAIIKAGEILAGRDLPLQQREDLAKQVGIGAVIFSALSGGRQADSIFSWEKILNFEGETSPYIQYTYVRIQSLLRKAQYTPTGRVDVSRLETEEEMSVIRRLARFPEAVKEAAERYEPAIIARYAIELAKSFNRFYHGCQVIDADDSELQSARLALCDVTGQVIINSLDLLGIDCPERM